MINQYLKYIQEGLLSNETEFTLNCLDNDQPKLKKYLEVNYKKQINTIIKKLSRQFKEKIDVRYTFMISRNYPYPAQPDLDFYLVNNKSNYPVHDSAGKKLAVVFVINPPGYTVKGKPRQITDEAVFYSDKNSKVKYMYKKKVKDINWKRLLDKAVEMAQLIRSKE